MELGERDLVWVTLDGRRLRVADMTTSHLRNCLRMIMRKTDGRRVRRNFKRKITRLQEKMAFNDKLKALRGRRTR